MRDLLPFARVSAAAMERFSSSARGSAAGGIRTFASGTMPYEEPAASPSAGRSRCIVIPRWSGTSGPPSDTINARSMAFCSQRVRGPPVKTLRPHPLPNLQTCHVRSGTVYTEALESPSFETPSSRGQTGPRDSATSGPPR